MFNCATVSPHAIHGQPGLTHDLAQRLSLEVSQPCDPRPIAWPGRHMHHDITEVITGEMSDEAADASLHGRVMHSDSRCDLGDRETPSEHVFEKTPVRRSQVRRPTQQSLS